MRQFKTILSVAALAATVPLATVASAGNPGISNQSYSAGKYSSNALVLANCPREYRGMYRGDLYCRQPAYQVLAPRHRLCPDRFRGMYRGDLYCVGRR